MTHRLPIFKDDLSFKERQSKVWGDMERDLERRRREWEDEIERMRKDFFTLKPDGDGRLEKLSDKFKMGDNLADDARGVIEKDQNGLPVFRCRFNVQSYTTEEVSVKMDSNKVIVNARHEEKSDSKSVSREYSREVDIPREVDPMTVQCSISTDGVLTVEAPMPTPQYGAIKDAGRPMQPRIENVQSSSSSTSSSARNTPPPLIQQQPLLSQQQPTVIPHQPPPPPGPPPATTQPLHQSTFTTFLSGAPAKGQGPGQVQVTQQPMGSPPNMTTNASRPFQPQTTMKQTVTDSGSSFSTVQDTDRKFKVDVDIEDFGPEELTVKTVDRKLCISARREEKIGNRTSTKELNREIHLPDTIDPYAVKAYFSDSGKLMIEAPYVRSVPISHYGDGFTNTATR